MQSKKSAKKGKAISAKGAMLMANMMKGKSKAPYRKPAVDAEDLKDGGIDEDKE